MINIFHIEKLFSLYFKHNKDKILSNTNIETDLDNPDFIPENLKLNFKILLDTTNSRVSLSIDGSKIEFYDRSMIFTVNGIINLLHSDINIKDTKNRFAHVMILNPDNSEATEKIKIIFDMF